MAKSIENKPVVNERGNYRLNDILNRLISCSALFPTLPTFKIPAIPIKPINVGHNRRGSFLPVPSSSSSIAVPLAGTKRRASVSSGQAFSLTEAEIEERVRKSRVINRLLLF